MATITLAAPATRRPLAGRPLEQTAPVRLTARGRRLARTLVVSLALLVTLAVALAWHAPAGTAGTASTGRATSTVVVQPGQTLWDVARSVAPNSDIRETVARIKGLSDLSGPSSSTVHPGQQLVVPLAG
jgi:hypothetical protein